jgi:hypothetical protein
MLKIVVEIVALVLVGLVAGAEAGSWSCVQPLIPKLPYAQQIEMEQRMLRTFGRLMPFLMPLSGILTVTLVFLSSVGTSVFWLRILAATCIGITIITTLAVNIPINARTSRWKTTDDASEWHRLRQRWHYYQGVRAGLFMAAFVVLTVAAIAWS